MRTWGYFVRHGAPAFTKGILATWLGDTAILHLTASGCVDALAAKINDLHSARKVERLLATIADSILDELQPHFENEFSRIKPGDENHS
jgi:hypothetical protein